MEKHVILFALMIVYLRRVNSFTCYITEIGTGSTTELLNKTHQEKNCKDQPSNILPIPINLTGDDKSISCFKMVGKDSNGHKVAIKGCIPAGTCDTVKDSILSNSKKADYVELRLPEDTKCYECESDRCNAASTFSCSGFSFIFFLLYIYGAF